MQKNRNSYTSEESVCHGFWRIEQLAKIKRLQTNIGSGTTDGKIILISLAS
jgi:hypothetical protein